LPFHAIRPATPSCHGIHYVQYPVHGSLEPAALKARTEPKTLPKLYKRGGWAPKRLTRVMYMHGASVK
jgi:hypothetical protein